VLSKYEAVKQKLDWPTIPQYRPAKSNVFILWMLLLLAIAAFTAVLIFTNVEAANLHATQPDPRIEWVEVDASGITICTSDSTRSAPLPKGSMLSIPVVVTTPVPHSHKEA